MCAFWSSSLRVNINPALYVLESHSLIPAVGFLNFCSEATYRKYRASIKYYGNFRMYPQIN